MLERLPERYKSPSVARAITSPSGLLLAGAGMSAAILGGLPIIVAAGIGAAAWAARVLFAVPRTPREQRIDPFRLREPWRRLVQDALQAETRFGRSVQTTRSGPLRDRLTDIGRRIHTGVLECWRIAQQGHNLEGALRQLDIVNIRAELEEVEEEIGDHRRNKRDVPPSLDRTHQAVLAQAEPAERIARVATEARDRLRLLNAQLDEAVARAVELSLQAHDVSDLSPLTDDVDNLVTELEALRQAIEETEGMGGVAAAGR